MNTNPAAADEKRVALCARMYEVRKSARFLYGIDYARKIFDAIVLIERLEAKAGVEPIRFLPWLAAQMKADGQEIGAGDVILFTAATVELIERRQTKPNGATSDG